MTVTAPEEQVILQRALLTPTAAALVPRAHLPEPPGFPVTSEETESPGNCRTLWVEFGAQKVRIKSQRDELREMDGSVFRYWNKHFDTPASVLETLVARHWHFGQRTYSHRDASLDGGTVVGCLIRKVARSKLCNF